MFDKFHRRYHHWGQHFSTSYSYLKGIVYVSISFTEWDYDNNVATEYERKGQCNQCGECCVAKITYIAIPHLKDCDTLDPHNWWLYVDGKGIWNEVSWHGTRKYLKLTEIALIEKRCENLTRSNKCLEHLFSGRSSLLCGMWPLSPRCVEPFPNCGFSFVEVNHWTIEKEE